MVEKPRSRRRMFITAALIGLAALVGLALAREIIRNNYYVAAHEGTVSIMRGISGSILGIRMQGPYLLGCLNDHNELSQISYGQPEGSLDCRLMRLHDLRPSERAQVSAGLPGGSLDEAIEQLRELARTSLLPLCPRPAVDPAPSAPGPTATSPVAPTTAPTLAPTHAMVPPGRPGPAPGPSDQTLTAPTSLPLPTTAGSPPPPSPTVTALPLPPPEPGTDCRAAA